MNKRAVTTSFMLSVLFAAGLTAPVLADNGVDFSLTVSDAAIQVTVPATASLVLNPTSSTSVFDSTTIDITVSTNNATGYSLHMTPSSTTLTGTSNATIETLASNADGYTEQSFTVNKWGYRILNNENYKAVPATLSPEEWTTDGPANTSTKNLTLAAKLDGSQPADTYATTLNFQAVANPNSPKDTIIFNGNGADSGSMSNQSVYQGESVRLAPNAFVKEGYYFNGWNTNINGNMDGYGDEDEYNSINTGTAQTITLYAQWKQEEGSQGGGGGGRTLQAAYEQAYVYNTGIYWDSSRNTYKHGLYVPVKDPNTGEYTGDYFEADDESDYYGIPANDLRFAIQDIDLEVDGVKVCDRTTVIGSGAYVLDLRDYRSYHIVKGADGRCWMQDNLALVPTNPTVAARMNSDNTNATNAVIQHLLNGGATDNPGWSTVAVSDRSAWSYTEPVIYSAKKDDPSADPWDQQYGWLRGVNYTYCAASAGTFCWRDQDPDYTDPHPDSKVKVDNDLCPKGWRMPTGGNGGEYGNLFGYYYESGSGYNIRNFRKAYHIAMSLPLDYVDGTGVQLFSSSYFNAGGVSALQMGSDFSINPNFENLVSWMQASVRCIAK